VPLSSTGPGDRGAIEVIRAWAGFLRTGDVDRAASFWGLPAQVQNGTPVLKLVSRDDVRTFNRSLTCGSILTSAGRGNDEFTIVKLRLTRRPGADCGAGTRKRARTAIRVLNGKIVEWYRLPDDPRPSPPAGAPAPQSPVI
jgi:hypothetical protein